MTWLGLLGDPLRHSCGGRADTAPSSAVPMQGLPISLGRRAGRGHTASRHQGKSGRLGFAQAHWTAPSPASSSGPGCCTLLAPLPPLLTWRTPTHPWRPRFRVLSSVRHLNALSHLGSPLPCLSERHHPSLHCYVCACPHPPRAWSLPGLPRVGGGVWSVVEPLGAQATAEPESQAQWDSGHLHPIPENTKNTTLL